jgi:ribonuclease-3
VILSRGLKHLFLYGKEQRHLLFRLKKLLSFFPADLSFYQIALRHKSATIITLEHKINNERLEFLGDAVIDLVISDYLYRTYPDNDEGTLSLMRANMVQRKTMNELAVSVGIPDLLVTGDNACGQTKNIFGNALEALAGAVYIDRGYVYCKRFIEKTFISEFDQHKSLQVEYDHKSSLFHLVQEKKWEVDFDTFEQIESNESHTHFESHVLINKKYISKGKGWSKKEAEQNAAMKALDKLLI